MRMRWSSLLLAASAAAFLLSAAVLLRGQILTVREQSIFDDLAARVDETAEETAADGSGETERALSRQTADAAGVLPALQTICAENPELGGWVRIDGTEIDYPVMFTPEQPEKYLHLNFRQETSAPGTPFFGAGCALRPRSDNLIVFGHNMKSGEMFAALTRYADETFWRAHPSVWFSTLYEEGNYEILAAFATDLTQAESLRCYTFTDAADETDFDAFVAGVRAASLYDTGTAVTYGDELLTLSTCAYHTAEGRFVLIARKAEEARLPASDPGK